jgi:hypothetical protein
VAYALLGTVVVSILAWTFGPAVRARLTKKPDQPPAAQSSSPSPVAALPQAVDTAGATSDRFITHLERQLEAEEKAHAKTQRELERIREDSRREIAALQAEVAQLRQMLWQRGSQ